MIDTNKYIVQFVGFKTDLNESDFIQRWTPFASRFKNAGIQTIDLYKISENKSLTFISRNIWDEKLYFKNFPTGVAGSGSSGEISVTQLGGYWISEYEIEKPDEMKIFFTDREEDLSPTCIVRKRCTENVKYEYQVEITQTNGSILDKNQLNILTCTHSTTM